MLKRSAPDVLLTVPILELMRGIEGWLEDEEADVLIAGVSRAISELPACFSVVEIGSYLGRSTCVLGSVVKALRPEARVHAIDPHEGVLTGPGGTLMRVERTLDAFRRTLAAADLDDTVVVIVERSWDVQWDKPISFLFIDGLHDLASVRRDFAHYQPWIASGGYVAFHDYGEESLPCVKVCVDELVCEGTLGWVALAGTLALLRHEGLASGPSTDPVPIEAATAVAVDPADLLRIAHLTAVAAGDLLLSRSGAFGAIGSKSDPSDLVTDADLLAEDIARATIRRHRPCDGVLGEERGEDPGHTGVKWILDPLDGTVNYVAGIADWAVSVAVETRSLGGGGGGGGGAVRRRSRPRSGPRTDLFGDSRRWRMVQRITPPAAPAHR